MFVVRAFCQRSVHAAIRRRARAAFRRGARPTIAGARVALEPAVIGVSLECFRARIRARAALRDVPVRFACAAVVRACHRIHVSFARCSRTATRGRARRSALVGCVDLRRRRRVAEYVAFRRRLELARKPAPAVVEREIVLQVPPSPASMVQLMYSSKKRTAAGQRPNCGTTPFSTSARKRSALTLASASLNTTK